MAVTFVIGNAHHLWTSLFGAGTTISAAIASEFSEAVGKLYTSSLLAAGLVLMFITFTVLALAQLMLAQATKRAAPMSRDPGIYARRRLEARFFIALSFLAAVFGILWLTLILVALFASGLPGINLALFTLDSPPPFDVGGLRNAMVGSLLMIVIATVVGTPVGIFAGTYLAEYGRFGRLTLAVRMLNDILLSAPSIVVGLFVYEVLVANSIGHFSGIAGAARPRGDRHSRRRAHDRKHAASYPGFTARSRGCPRSSAVEGHPPRSVARGALRHRNRHHLSGGAHQRRDGTAVVQRSQTIRVQPRSHAADGEPSRDDLPNGAQPVQRLASARVVGCPRCHIHRARA